MTVRARTPRVAALFLAAAAVLTTAVGTGSAVDHTRRPAALDGTWRMDGYGTVVSIDGGGHRLRTYDTTAVSCLPGLRDAVHNGSRDGAGRRFEQQGEAPVTVAPAGRDKAVLRFTDNVGHRTLHRIPELPAECRRTVPEDKADPRDVFDVFWQTYAENYPFFAAKHIDWQAVRERFRPRVTKTTDDKELFAVLREMIEPLHDGHTAIEAPGRQYGGKRQDTVFTKETKPRIDAAVAESVGVPEAAWQTWAQGAISFAELPGGVGYLRVTRFQDYTEDGGHEADRAELDRALDAVFTSARTRGPGALRGLVLDVRFNGGGSDRLALRLAERLTDRPYTAYLKHARNDPRDPGKFTTPQPIGVSPHRGPVYTGPVAVLTGRLTISAGETFTQALMGRAHETTRIGENTQGAFSDTLDRKLPNGWTFLLPNEEFLSAADRRTTYDGQGIPPDIATPVFTDEEFAAHRDSALTRARALLGGSRG
ncbi:S41 family peptidase [Streptomyces sp. NPDC046215]|uniref:S41 family peptidase n=1 Tax=Streptomyces stramineus TaxID=173861 RepID=A0ABN1BAK7_9ACTN